MKIVVCCHCGWTWVTKQERPNACRNPKCRTIFWDSPYKQPRGRKRGEPKPKSGRGRGRPRKDGGANAET
jgi:hypothetical protein